MHGPQVRVIHGDSLDVLASIAPGSVQCCVTSPPYWGLRDYGHDGQIGLEETPEDYIGRLVEVFRAVHTALRDDGTLWLNLGDSYASGGGANQLGRNDAGRRTAHAADYDERLAEVPDDVPSERQRGLF